MGLYICRLDTCGHLFFHFFLLQQGQVFESSIFTPEVSDSDPCPKRSRAHLGDARIASKTQPPACDLWNEVFSYIRGKGTAVRSEVRDFRRQINSSDFHLDRRKPFVKRGSLDFGWFAMR